MVAHARAAPIRFIDPADMPDMYAVPGVGTCMQPRVMDGERLVFDKRQEPSVGDVVALWFTEELAQRVGMPGWVKMLEIGLPPPLFDGLIVVGQLNPPRSYVIPAADVLAVHKAVGKAEIAGDGRAAFNPAKGGV